MPKRNFVKRYLRFSGLWLKVEQYEIMSGPGSAEIALDDTHAMIPLYDSFTNVFQWVGQTGTRDDDINFEIVLQSGVLQPSASCVNI